MKPRSHDVTMQTACPVVDSPDLPPSPRDSSAWIRHPGLATPVMAANSSTGAKRVIVGHSRWNRFLRCYWPEGNTADVTKDDARDQPYQAMEMEPLQIRPRPPRQHRIQRFTSHTRPTLPCSWPPVPTANMSAVGPTSFSTGMPFAARLFYIENGPSAAPAGSPVAAGQARALSIVSCRGTNAQSLIEVRQHVGTQYCYAVTLVSLIVPVDGELCPRSRSWQRQTLRASEQGYRCHLRSSIRTPGGLENSCGNGRSKANLDS